MVEQFHFHDSLFGAHRFHRKALDAHEIAPLVGRVGVVIGGVVGFVQQRVGVLLASGFARPPAGGRGAIRLAGVAADLLVHHIRHRVHCGEQGEGALLAAQGGAAGADRHLRHEPLRLRARRRARDLKFGGRILRQMALQAGYLLLNIVLRALVQFHIPGDYPRLHKHPSTSAA